MLMVMSAYADICYAVRARDRSGRIYHVGEATRMLPTHLITYTGPAPWW
jgi:hypothetical protein